MIGGDVVPEHGEGAHPAKGARLREGPFPVGRAPDVGALGPPVIVRAHRLGDILDLQEHGVVDVPELRGLHGLSHQGVDFFVARPDVGEADWLAGAVRAQHVLFDVEANGAGEGVGDHQGRRGQEGLLRIGVDAAIEVAVAREYGGSVKVPVDDLLLDHRIQGAGHAIAGGAGKGHHAEAQLLKLRQQGRLREIGFYRLRPRRQGGLYPGFAGEAGAIGVPGQKPRGDHVAGVRGVRAARDGGDDDRSVGHFPGFLLVGSGDAAARKLAHGQARVGVGGSGQGAGDGAEVEAEHPLVLDLAQIIGPEAAVLGVGLDQGDLRILPPREAQVGEGLLVDGKHRSRGAVLRRHVGNGGPITEAEGPGPFAKKLEVGSDHPFPAEEFG